MQARRVTVTPVSAKEGGSPRRAPKPRSSTRDRILKASLTLFATHGFDGTDIVDIEGRVGLTPGSGGFYRHFKNKEDVLHAAIEAEIARVQAFHSSLEQRRSHDDPEAAIGYRIGIMLEMLWEMRSLISVIAHDSGRFPELVPKIAVAMADSGVALDAAELSRMMGEGGIPRRPADVVATIMMMASVGYTLAETLFGRPIAEIDRERFGQVLTDLVTGRESD